MMKATAAARAAATNPSMRQKFWEWTSTGAKNVGFGGDFIKYSKDWWQEWTIKCVLFAITGTSSMKLVRPVLREATGIEGTFRDGPNSYRAMSLMLMTPIYTMLLLTVGTLGGRHTFYRGMATKMWGRIPGLNKPFAGALDKVFGPAVVIPKSKL